MKTRLLLFILFNFLIIRQIDAQNFNEAELAGGWKVVNIIMLDSEISKEEQASVTLLKNAFLKSKFYFKEDRSFEYKIDVEELQIKKAHWKLRSQTNTVLIQEWKDKSTDDSVLMEIKIKKEKGKILFQIAESPFILEMKKE